jgi:hypothetical protein
VVSSLELEAKLEFLDAAVEKTALAEKRRGMLISNRLVTLREGHQEMKPSMTRVGGGEKGVHIGSGQGASVRLRGGLSEASAMGVRDGPGSLRPACRPLWGHGRDTTCL